MMKALSNKNRGAFGGPNRALTLMEMVIALAIMVVVFAAVLPQFRNIQNSWASRQGGAEALQNGRILIEHLNRHLAKAVKINTVSAPAETNGYIEFEDNNGDSWRYEINASNYIEFGALGNLSGLAGPVSKLQFTCYDVSDLDTPITDVDSIRLVKVDTTLTNSCALGCDKTFSMAAYIHTNWYSPSFPVPIGWWELDDGSGQIAADSLGDTNDGQLGSSTDDDSNDPTWISDPTRGDVLSFDGADDYVTGIGNCPTGNYTVACWAKDTGSIASGKWSAVYSAGQELWFGVDRSASPSIWLNVGGNSSGAYTASGTWTRDVWHHLATTWDGSTAHIYLDGVDMPITIFGTPENPESEAAMIGTWSEKVKEQAWPGLISDVYIYDQALTAEEIVTLADGGWEIAP